MEKARSLLETEASLDEVDEGLYEASRGDEGSAELSRVESGLQSSSAGGQRSVPHPSGFVPASVSQSGFSPIGVGRRESSALSLSAGPPGDRLHDSLQTALGASSRSEAGLATLQRAIRDASRAFTASRQAHEALTEELRVMHRGLNELMSEKAAIERYAALLTEERDAALDAAEEARREARRDREFLLREQDRFIQLLLEEHEAELQQLRRTLGQRSTGGETSTGQSASSGSTVSRASAQAQAEAVDVPPHTIPGIAPALGEEVVEGRKSAPPGEFLSGAALARQALANAADANPSGASSSTADPSAPNVSAASVSAASVSPANASAGHSPADMAPPGIASTADPLPRTVPLPSERPGEGASETRRGEGEASDVRAPTYPPAPAVLDLDSLAAEIDGNSERPPPIRRIHSQSLGGMEPTLHLKPARVPAPLYDTMVSPGEVDPTRKT